MKKAVAYSFAALLGICAGIIVHCSVMVVEVEGCMMLPWLEPNQNALISLLDKDIKEGDVVAFEAPYYTLNGEGNIIFRRVKIEREDSLVLTCDTRTTKEESFEISKEDILGKVIFPNVE